MVVKSIYKSDAPPTQRQRSSRQSSRTVTTHHNTDAGAASSALGSLRFAPLPCCGGGAREDQAHPPPQKIQNTRTVPTSSLAARTGSCIIPLRVKDTTVLGRGGLRSVPP